MAAPTSLSPATYLFGPFTLHAGQRLLTRGREVVPLTSKAFEILLTLVERPRDVVGKDDLLARVWPEQVVEESNLTQTIFLLRKALGDPVKEHRYIVTVPKRGYCFVAEVRALPESAGRSARGSEAALPRRFSEATEAETLCLRGRHFWSKRTASALEKAIRCFEQAIEKEPRSARAHAGLADCYTLLSHTSRLPPRQTMPKAEAAARRALELDDRLVEAHTSLAVVQMLYHWDWAAAAAGFRRALETGRPYPTAHHWHGMYLVAQGEFDRAIAEVERAQELDPLSLAINTDLGLVLYLARRFDEAVRQYRVAMDLDPAFSDARLGILMAYDEMGMYPEPISELLRAPETGGREVSARLEAAYAEAGVKGYWRAYLELADAPSRDVACAPYVRARLHAGIGEEEKALAWLETACDERDGGLSLVKVDPCLDRLRGTPGLRRVLERVGLG